MASELEIANAALQELGQDRISSLDQASESARTMKSILPLNRDALIEEHPWNFATRRAELAILAGAPKYGYERQFALPIDFVRLLEIEPAVEHKVEGGCILTDAEALLIKYVGKVTDPNLMPPTFRMALALRLAARSAKKITGSDTEKVRVEQLYSLYLATAKSSDAMGGGTPPRDRPTFFIDARE
ncbi:MAG: hypothetical protein PHV85_00490 [Desulfovibrionaceae bacterium]|nr:hypothetical protein [Desulfovibrionaceae bacterium]